MPHPLHQFVCATALSVTLGCGVVTAIQSGRGARPLISHIQEAIGSLPADCGYFNALATGDEPRPDRLRAAVACIGASARGAKPAWFRVYAQGFDSQVAYGLMVGPDGSIRHFVYDSDPSGGSGAGSRFTATPCPTPEVEGERVRCEPR